MAGTGTSDPHIAILLPGLGGGGAERVVLNLSSFLIGEGRKVDLIVGRAGGPYSSQVPAGVRVIDLESRRLLAALPRLIGVLQRERPEVLLSAMEHTNLVGLWARQLSRAPVRVVISVHNTLSHNLGRSPSWRDRRMPWLAKRFYRKADCIIAVSEGVADDLVSVAGLARSEIRVIYNPVVTPELVARAEEPLVHPWLVPGAAPVVLGAGRLSPQKDFATLLRAFAQVRAARPVRLIILGEGELRGQLEAQAAALCVSEDVQFPGFVDNPYAYMRRAGVFVLSSAWEGFGIVLVEAMACGAPVVSTDCPVGPAEILDGGRYGPLVPVGDGGALAQSILSMLDRPMDPERLRARAGDFALDKIGRQYLEVLCPR